MRCRGCSYLLWNLSDARCPECGRSFDWRTYRFRPNTIAVECPACGKRHPLTPGDTAAFQQDQWLCNGCQKSVSPVALRIVPLTANPRKAEAIQDFDLREPPGTWRHTLRVVLWLVELAGVAAIFMRIGEGSFFFGPNYFVPLDAMRYVLRSITNGSRPIMDVLAELLWVSMFLLTIPISWLGLLAMRRSRTTRIERLIGWSLAACGVAALAVMWVEVCRGSLLEDTWGTVILCVSTLPPLLAIAMTILATIRRWPEEPVLQCVLRLLFLHFALFIMGFMFDFSLPGFWLLAAASAAYIVSIIWWTVRIIRFHRGLA